MDNVIKTEKLTEGPIQIRTKVKKVRNIRVKEVETVLVVSELIPNRIYTVKSDNSGMTVEYGYQFAATMGYIEMSIEKVRAEKDSYSLDHQFFIIKTRTIPNFEIYDEDSNYKREEAAWFYNRYISR